MTLRTIIFWLHLAAGLIAGTVIGVMSITGVALAFEKEIVAWSERSANRIGAPAQLDAPRLPFEELLHRVNEAQPDFKPSSLIVKNDPEAAVAFSLGRSGAVYANPHTGEVRVPEATAWRGFMSTMTTWHRYLAMSGDNRATGKAITGACNAAFLVLGLTGLYLWWPRAWSRRMLQGITFPRFNLRGKARDWNWHNAIGLWSAFPIIVMTATAMPISYQWAGALLNRLNGPVMSTPPAPEISFPTPTGGARALGFDALIASAQRHAPDWKQITLYLGGAPAGGRGTAPARLAAAPARSDGPQPITVSIREAGSWPRTATTTLALNPYTGEVMRAEGYRDLPLGRQVRAWTRFLHTGEALGPIGQAVAGLGSLGGVFLVWTGFALSWRRFFKRIPSSPRIAANTIKAEEPSPVGSR